MLRFFEVVMVPVLWLLYVESHVVLRTGLKQIMATQFSSNEDFYKTLVEDIKSERDIDSILIMQNDTFNYCRIQAIQELNIPKILIPHGQVINYKQKFNSEILVVVIIENNLEETLLEPAALSLNNMRQTRMLVIGLNINNSKKFKKTLLILCQKYKMANVIIHLSTIGQPFQLSYYRLKPYPKYYLETVNMSAMDRPYYKQHWRNMQNATLLTLPDQNVQNSVIYKDTQGRVQFGGDAATLVLLFAHKFNASLKLSYDVQPGEPIRFDHFANLTLQGIVDIPMSYCPLITDDFYIRMSYPTQVGSYMVMLPIPQQKLIKEVYTLIVSKDIFVAILISTVAFSLVHSAVDYVTSGQLQLSNVLISDKVLPGILGQSFVQKISPLVTLKIIYLLIFLLGLNLNTIFAANFKTLVISPPYHRRIKTFADISKSNVDVLLDPSERRDEVGLAHLAGHIIYAPNLIYFQNARGSLNTSYGYPVATSLWVIFSNLQIYFAQNLFYVTPQIKLRDLLSYGIILAENSMFKEPLDYFIHYVHNAGLLGAWRTRSVLDMIRHKNFTRPNIRPSFDHRALTADDLSLPWTILLIGLASGFLIFLVEFIYKKNIFDIKCNFMRKN